MILKMILTLLTLQLGALPNGSQLSSTDQQDLGQIQKLIDAILADPHNAKARADLNAEVEKNLNEYHREVRQEMASALREALKASGKIKTKEQRDRVERLLGAVDSGLLTSYREANPTADQKAISKNQPISPVTPTTKKRKPDSRKPREILAPPAPPAKLTPQLSQAHKKFREGVLLYSERRLSAAAEAFREGLALDPKNEWTKKALERTLEEQESERLFREGIRLYEQRRLSAAAEAFKKSLELDPGNEWALKSLERTLAEMRVSP